MNTKSLKQNNIIFYESDDGKLKINIKLQDKTI